MEYSLDETLEYGRELCSALTYKMIDSYSTGKTKEADEMAINACLIRADLMMLEFYQSNQADITRTFTDIHRFMSTIHEFNYAEYLDISEFIGQTGSDKDALGTTGNVVILKSGSITQQPRSYKFNVVSNGQTAFTMPFNISAIDKDSVSLVLNSWMNPIIDVDYSITATTLNWLSDVPLTIGYSFEIKYTA